MRDHREYLTGEAVESNLYQAGLVAKSANQALETYFEAVGKAATDRELIDRLKMFLQAGAAIDLLEKLRRPDLNNSEEQKNLEQSFQNASRDMALQKWVTEHFKKDKGEPFSWFVTGPAGVQLAREPRRVGKRPVPIGMCFSYRSYFTGLDRDFKDVGEYIATGMGRHIREVRMSAVFLSKVTDQWVVAVSAPVWDDGVDSSGEREFLGVVGLMIQLGRFAKLDAENPNRFPVLVDSRGDNAGVILQHPNYDCLDYRERVPDKFQSDLRFRVLLDEMEDRNSSYFDPMSRDDSRDDNPYARRWLGSKVPVAVPGQDKGLFLIVQESHDVKIGRPLAELTHSVIVLSAANLGLMVVLLIPLWALVLRMFRK